MNFMANAFSLRLPVSTRLSARDHAAHEGMSLNKVIVMAIAEKIVRLDESQIPHQDAASDSGTH